MDLMSLVAALGQADSWPDGVVLESTLGSQFSTLDVCFPLPCARGVVAWRRNALVVLGSTSADPYSLPAPFFDYMNEWNTGRVLIVAPSPFSDQVLALSDMRCTLISLDEDPTEDIEALTRGLPSILHPQDSLDDLTRILDEYTSATVEPIPFRSVDEMIGASFNAIGIALQIIDGCDRPMRSLGSVRSSSAVSNYFATDDSAENGRQIYIDSERLTPSLELYRRLVKLLPDSDEITKIRDSLLPACRGSAMLRLAFRNSNSLADAIGLIEDGLPALRGPEVQRTVARMLRGATIQNIQALHHYIRRLSLDGPEIVAALSDQAVSAPTTSAVWAIESLGALRVERCRSLLSELASHPRKSVREAAENAERTLNTERSQDRFEAPIDYSVARRPMARYFHGPKNTVLSLSPMGEWDSGPLLVVTIHSDGTRDMLMGGTDVLRTARAQLLGLIELPEERNAAMGEVVMLDEKTGVVTKQSLKAADSEDDS